MVAIFTIFRYTSTSISWGITINYTYVKAIGVQEYSENNTIQKRIGIYKNN